MTDKAQPIYQDELSIIRQADFCALPGYLVVRFKNGARSMSDLNPSEASRLGVLLANTVAAIETVTGADRVYSLVLAEVDRNLHFHLFPRTEQLREDYQQATGTAGQPVNGTALFEWARETFKSGTQIPPGYPDPAWVCAELTRLMNKI